MYSNIDSSCQQCIKSPFINENGNYGEVVDYHGSRMVLSGTVTR